MKAILNSEREGQVVGRELRSGRLVRLSWNGGLVRQRAVLEDDGRDYRWIAPSLFDLQVNGFGGVDFQSPTISIEELTGAVVALQERGCGGVLVTLITDDWTSMLAKLERLMAFRESCPRLRQFILGWHLEGPFLSSLEGFRGAHPAAMMRDPDPDIIPSIMRITGKVPVLMTIAPERRGAVSMIKEAVEQDIRVSLGHSAASAAELRAAIDAGARGITHFGNGCPQLWERHDNWFWSVSDCLDLYVGLIPDGIHLPGPVFRGMHRMLKDRHQVYYTSDAMSAAGAGCGRFSLAGHLLEVGEDQVVRQPGQPNFAGSALSPLDGVLRASAMLGGDWRDAWNRFSRVPAVFMGIDWEITEGRAVNFCAIDVPDTGTPEHVEFFYCDSDL